MRRLSNAMETQRRLFVPLNTEPFDWFARGEKRWELRKLGRQYSPKHLMIGRVVELRRGYAHKESALWGTIEAVMPADTVDDFFNKVRFEEVIPKAPNKEAATAYARSMLNVKPGERVVGFRVRLHHDSSGH
jgi:hypothetical protein